VNCGAREAALGYLTDLTDEKRREEQRERAIVSRFNG